MQAQAASGPDRPPQVHTMIGRNVKGSSKETTLRLREGFKARQEALLAQFQTELRQVSAGDVVLTTRIKHKYRQRGLNIS